MIFTKKPKFFPTPLDFRKWFEKYHAKETELFVGFYKVGSGKPSITWPESVQQALCFGWIDGVRKSIDGTRYMIRFTPRKPTSIWSSVNIKFVAELTKQGLMTEAGLTAFNARKGKKSEIYSYEQERRKFNRVYEKEIRANKKAWTFFQSQPPWYRRTSGHWVMSAKREETRDKRLAELIRDSANGKRIGQLSIGKKQ
ncbi:MAG: YdeI/OmpD-associated family protein [Bacteroidota bacterium]|nr:YdeI/OmpD-associated family protein [Bacteroidota bacterium]